MENRTRQEFGQREANSEQFWEIQVYLAAWFMRRFLEYATNLNLLAPTRQQKSENILRAQPREGFSPFTRPALRSSERSKVTSKNPHAACSL
jgi:hypothetical protein